MMISTTPTSGRLFFSSSPHTRSQPLVCVYPALPPENSLLPAPSTTHGTVNKTLSPAVVDTTRVSNNKESLAAAIQGGGTYDFKWGTHLVWRRHRWSRKLWRGLWPHRRAPYTVAMAACEEHERGRGNARKSGDYHAADPSLLSSAASASFEPLEIGRRAACSGSSSSFSPANTLDASDPQVGCGCAVIHRVGGHFMSIVLLLLTTLTRAVVRVLETFVSLRKSYIDRRCIHALSLPDGFHTLDVWIWGVQQAMFCLCIYR